MDEAYKELLEDMSVHPGNYSMPLMRRLLGERTDSVFSGPADSPAGRFLQGGMTLEKEALVQEGIIPDISFRFVQHLRHYLVPVPVPPERFTEVLLIGEPGAGKTAVLSGILSYCYDTVLAYPRCTAENGALDRSAENCLELIRGLRDHFFPARADKPFVRYNTVLAETPSTGWSFVDLRARDIVKLTSFDSTDHGLSSIDPSLRTPNSKCLFFIVDTEAWLREDEEGVIDNQGLFLVKALTVLSHDGPDNSRPMEGCTFSRVKSVAVILSKSDCWDNRIPDNLTRGQFFEKRLARGMALFMNDLKDICRQYHISCEKDGSVRTIPFSLGRRYVGNLVQYNPTSSGKVAEFLLQNRPKGSFRERLFK